MCGHRWSVWESPACRYFLLTSVVTPFGFSFWIPSWTKERVINLHICWTCLNIGGVLCSKRFILLFVPNRKLQALWIICLFVAVVHINITRTILEVGYCCRCAGASFTRSQGRGVCLGGAPFWHERSAECRPRWTDLHLGHPYRHSCCIISEPHWGAGPWSSVWCKVVTRWHHACCHWLTWTYLVVWLWFPKR